MQSPSTETFSGKHACICKPQMIHTLQCSALCWSIPCLGVLQAPFLKDSTGHGQAGAALCAASRFKHDPNVAGCAAVQELGGGGGA